MPLLSSSNFATRGGGSAIAAIAIAMALLSPAQIARSQEATPAPAACTAAPRSADFLVDLINLPAPDATPQPLAGLPEGTDDVAPETRAAVLAVLDELTACVNAGQLLRAFSLFDDAYLRRVIDPDGLMTENVALELGGSFATPIAVGTADTQTVEEVLLVRGLADGSVVIVFRSSIGDEVESQIDLLTMREIDGAWRIVDGLTDLDPEALPNG